MVYKTTKIKGFLELSNCSKFNVDNFMWNSLQQPVTTGRMGLTSGGFIVEMTCNEPAPKAEYHRHLDPVYKDSAMEAFFCFVPKNTTKPTLDSFYTNIEFNANGAVYAAFGYGRKNRTKYSIAQIEQLDLQISSSGACWRAQFMLPNSLIADLYPEEHQTWVNFYKISESPEIEHYGSFSRIDSDTPNFHRPDCFAVVEIN